MRLRHQPSIFEVEWSPVYSTEQYHRRQQQLVKAHRCRSAYIEMTEWWETTLKVQAINRRL